MNDNDLLVRIAGQYIAAGSRSLLSAETSTDETQHAQESEDHAVFWTVESAERRLMLFGTVA